MTRILLLLINSAFASAFFNPYPKVRPFDDGGDPGLPLFLTPFIESDKIDEGRNLSRVSFSGFPETESYSGFITVDKKYDSNLFFWYFKPEKCLNLKCSPKSEPALYIWLQGGPGVSSLFGLFKENGPFMVVNGTLQHRDMHWSLRDHVLYIDNPVGTGYSFTNDSKGYCTNQTQIASHLYTFLIQFMQLFPELQTRALFLMGQGYAGKYVPAFGYYIHQKNPTAELKLNLTGLVIGNGWSDPENQLEYGEYLYQLGLLDLKQKVQAEELQNGIKELIKTEKWREARIVLADLYKYLRKVMGDIPFHNYMETDVTYSEDFTYASFVQATNTRKAIHVGNLSYDQDSDAVHYSLTEDMVQSVAPWISELLEHYFMFFYSGQNSIIDAYPLTLDFLKKLKFSGADSYMNASRTKILTKDKNILKLTSYYKSELDTEMYIIGKLTDCLIRNAGYFVSAEFAETIYYEITSWRLDISKLWIIF